MLKILKTIALWSAGGLVAFLGFGAFLTVFNGPSNSTPAPVKQAKVEPKLLDPWPFTVEYVTLKCRVPMDIGMGGVTATAPDGTEFAINGIGLGDDYPSLNAIRKDHPEIKGLKIDIGQALDAAKALCLDTGHAARPRKVTPGTLKISSQFNKAN